MAINLSTEASIYKGIQWHVGHNIEVGSYAEGENLAIECLDCCTVLLSADRPEMDENGDPA